MSFSKVALSSIRFATRVWPFPVGQGLPSYLGAFATRVGVLKAEWYEFQPGLWMKLNSQDLIQQTILLEGAWDPPLTQLVQSRLGAGDVFIDVGAHVGYFTLLASQRAGPTGTVLAIEPNPVAREQLRENVSRSRLDNVLIEASACGECRTTVDLHLHTASNSSMASLSTANARGGTTVSVPCTTLDVLCQERGIGRVTLVKIDVEGAELSVLRGMTRILGELRPIIVLELDAQLLAGFGTPLADVLAVFDDFDYVVSPLGGHSNYVCRPRLAGASH